MIPAITMAPSQRWIDQPIRRDCHCQEIRGEEQRGNQERHEAVGEPAPPCWPDLRREIRKQAGDDRPPE